MKKYLLVYVNIERHLFFVAHSVYINIMQMMCVSNEMKWKMKWKVQWFKVRSKTDLEPA